MTHSFRKGQVLAKKKKKLHNGSSLTQTIYWIWDSYQWAGKTKHTWSHLNQNEVMRGASTYFAACCSSSSQHPDRKLVSLWDTHSPSAFSLPAFSAVSCEAFNRGFRDAVAFRRFSHGSFWHLLPSVDKDAINDAQGIIFLLDTTRKPTGERRGGRRFSLHLEQLTWPELRDTLGTRLGTVAIDWLRSSEELLALCVLVAQLRLMSS